MTILGQIIDDEITRILAEVETELEQNTETITILDDEAEKAKQMIIEKYLAVDSFELKRDNISVLIMPDLIFKGALLMISDDFDFFDEKHCQYFRQAIHVLHKWGTEEFRVCDKDGFITNYIYATRNVNR